MSLHWGLKLLISLSFAMVLNTLVLKVDKTTLTQSFQIRETFANSFICSDEKIRILCLHGYLASSSIFQLQMREIIRQTENFTEYVFINAPHELNLFAKPNNSAIYRRSSDGNKKFRWWNTVEIDDNIIYEGIYDSLNEVFKVLLHQGPFDVILGHSQGASLLMALDVLLGNPDLAEDIITFDNSSDYKDLLAKISIPKLRVVMNGFFPRFVDMIKPSDQSPTYVSDTAFGPVLRNRAEVSPIDYQSIHVFSEEDSVNPPENSIDAMSMYAFPKIICRRKGHEPPLDETAENIATNLHLFWKRKFNKNRIKLED